jgi:ATP-dependent Clp protease ATP-binding subunit ClpB
VLLLDEIEKAHPDVFNVLLQVLDDGRLTDNQGRTVNFKNTIIIMTSNIGSHLIQEKMAGLNENNLNSVMNDVRISLMNLLQQNIRPEFLNRIDEVVLFKPLLKNELKGIINIQLQSVDKLLQEKNIKMSVTEKAKEFLLERGYDVTYGARPLKRTIQKYLLNPLSTEILLNKFVNGDTIIIDFNSGDKLEFRK